MRLTKKRADNGKYYLSGLAEVLNIYPKGYGRIQVGHAIDKLAEYEDLEEQGKLLKLPCAVGDVAYRINKGAKAKLIAMRVQDVKIFQVGGILSVKIGCVEDVYGGECNYLAEEIGRKVFLTREEAEAALKEL